MMQENIVSGLADVCRRKLNGKKQRAAKMAGNGRGEMIGRLTFAIAAGHPWRLDRWGNFRPQATALTASPTWPAMFGTGVVHSFAVTSIARAMDERILVLQESASFAAAL